MTATIEVDKQEWYSTTSTDTVSLLGTSGEKGLTSEEAALRLQTYGRNELQEAPPRTLLSLFIDQVKEVLVLMLIGAAVISTALGEWQDAVVILLIVVLNATLGVVQERKAERAMQALKQLSKPVAKVLRDGSTTQVNSAEVVPGDVVLLEAGDFIPADLRLLDVASLKINESALTGESEAVEKVSDTVAGSGGKLALGDQRNLGFMGTVVTYGRGRGVIIRTGMDTEIGRVASLIQEAPQEATPLQKRLEQLGKTLGLVAVVLVIIVFITGVLRGEQAFDMLMTAISLAVAAVPEGLPAIVTIVLALGVQKMSKQNAIIRRLPAVETLGAATIICSDKTGTLTKNEMTVVALYVDGKVSKVTDAGIEDAPPAASVLLQAGVLASDAQVEEKEGRARVIGDPTEGALVVAAKRGGYAQTELNQATPRLAELPFDSARKLMTTIHRWSERSVSVIDTPYVAFTKGAPDVLLNRCNLIYENGHSSPLTKEKLAELHKVNAQFASNGLRVLGLALRTWDAVPDSLESAVVEQKLTFVGFFAMQDPPRPEAREAVRESLGAGIRPVMITGDHKDTAIAIAKDLGIWKDEHKVLTGAELEDMTDEQLFAVAENVSVFARVSPEHKLRIVNAYKEHDHVVAMTGDGVNDAPALKRADIGAAMGITGTDVAKEAADMVLADDNFATIVSSIASGRTIFANIRKVVHYLLSCNTGEIGSIFFAIALGLGRPLTAIQILWLNLVTDGLPALALGVEPAEKDVMRHKPRKTNEGVLGGGLGQTILWQGMMIGGITLLGYWHTLNSGRPVEEARTVAFLILSLSQIVHSLNTRSMHTSVFKMGLLSNRPLVGAIVVSFILQLLVVVLPPLQPIFDTVSLPVDDWVWVTMLSLVPLVVAEVVKSFQRSKED